MRRSLLLLVSILAFTFGLATQAWAVPVGVINGATQLNVTSFGTLNSLGVTVTPGGTADVVTTGALPSPIVFYDITAVDLDQASTRIFHDGAVLDLTTTNTVSLSNFLIDATQGLVFADVVSPSLTGNAPVFTLAKFCSVADPCAGLDQTATIEGIDLQLTDAAGGLLALDLGIPDLTGAPVAVANSSFTPIPEPGTAVLGFVGLAGLSVVGRRRRL